MSLKQGEWKLKEFHVERVVDYSTRKAHYEGKVRFVSKSWEEFSLNLKEETTMEILRLILPDIAFASGRLQEDLWDSVNNQIKRIISEDE